jgi:PBP1b-binding outer membrane lipoprotein LpoB
MRPALLALLLLVGCQQPAAPERRVSDASDQNSRSASDSVEARLQALEAEDQRILNSLRSEQSAVNALSNTDQVLANVINATRQAHNDHLNSHGPSR